MTFRSRANLTLTYDLLLREHVQQQFKAKKMAEILLRGKRLAELKVTELKEELEKRKLPKKGVKNVLITRLKNAILKEELEVQVKI